MVPREYRVVYSGAQIAARVSELGAAISPWAALERSRSGKDIIVVPLLRGAMVFAADLIRSIQGSVEVAPLATESYDRTQNQALSDTLVGHIDAASFRGRSIIVVDDVCDSGRTLELVMRRFREMGADSVKSAVMVNRVKQSPLIVPDWIGFEFVGEEWFVGYGMDDQGRYRNLPDICVIEKK